MRGAGPQESQSLVCQGLPMASSQPVTWTMCWVLKSCKLCKPQTVFWLLKAVLLAKKVSQYANVLFPLPSKTQQYDCKWYIPLTDLSFQTVDESEAVPNIPLVLDEELDAMKIKISHIKNDIQREKVGPTGWEQGGFCGSSGQQPLAHRPVGELCCARSPTSRTPVGPWSSGHPVRSLLGHRVGEVPSCPDGAPGGSMHPWGVLDCPGLLPERLRRLEGLLPPV